jgi:hypothetical protein
MEVDGNYNMNDYDYDDCVNILLSNKLLLFILSIGIVSVMLCTAIINMWS